VGGIGRTSAWAKARPYLKNKLKKQKGAMNIAQMVECLSRKHRFKQEGKEGEETDSASL
jgi:hypothetical protein